MFLWIIDVVCVVLLALNTRPLTTIFFAIAWIAKKIDDPLPPLPEDERIYFSVPYMARDFAKYSHCGFDPKKKLWFTGSLNANLYALVRLYGVNETTSEKAMQLLKERIGNLTSQNDIIDESDCT